MRAQPPRPQISMLIGSGGLETEKYSSSTNIEIWGVGDGVQIQSAFQKTEINYAERGSQKYKKQENTNKPCSRDGRGPSRKKVNERIKLHFVIVFASIGASMSL